MKFTSKKLLLLLLACIPEPALARENPRPCKGVSTMEVMPFGAVYSTICVGPAGEERSACTVTVMDRESGSCIWQTTRWLPFDFATGEYFNAPPVECPALDLPECSDRFDMY